ncbi:MAG: ABC transporter substrate-binding protein [Deltaproteobacteria bacterium]|nr:ABC transporter substrate-binding protein [Deltaproteobacteria bacterium]MBW2085241.1 ABC transporter substrate-binding protein [Deltaproteobacteria bacterium]
MRSRKCWVLVFPLVFILFILTSSGSLAGSKDTVLVGELYHPTTIDPFQYRGSKDAVVFGAMFQSLMGIDDKSGEMVLSLAQSIKILENGRDIQVRLRKGPKFSTGDPVTAADFRFSWQQHTDKINKSLLRSVYARIKDVEIIDDYSFIYRFNKPYSPWESLMSMSIGSKKYYDKVGREVWIKKPVGSAPFTLVERKIGESVILQAVKNHHDTKVGFNTLKILSVPDEMTRLAMMETGELDLIYKVLPHHTKRLARNKRIKIKRSGITPSFYYISFRMVNDPAITDLKLRKAFQYAINRQEIIDNIYFKEGYPHYMACESFELGYNPDLKYKFDPEKARKLIKESSYKSGTPLMLTYTDFVPNGSQLVSAVQQYLKKVGVTVKLQYMESGTYLTYSRKKDKRIGAMSLSSWPGSRDPVWRIMLAIKSDGYYTWYPNRPNKDVIDKLISEQSVEMDKKKRSVILKKMHLLLREDPDIIPIFGLNMIYAMQDRIDYDWVPVTGEIAHFWNIKIVK